MDIKKDNLQGEEIKELIIDHLNSMTLHSPPESIHALNLDELRKPELTFWTVWEGSELLGCGALKELSATDGEIKSMKTSPQHLRKGVSTCLLQFIIDEAKQRGYTRLSLETGSMAAFAPARKLYEKFGFHYCNPFSNYREDENSVFMTKEIY
ncbi:GNAT family N-acetyltransferase [Gracilibacillus salinarum]|uniref:GNAT family N-acetyltransferase n=1 Tax=Gracilibacillus salinarum TaxID=2932255 RepID=A0ABY4GQG2_9BACI|nr:GNAT family N-acetyltransferase [Gracilibacillus salinarum]UOQ86370.1 GNAT family N-acetyltransferase [Gracilibacillus salinarum]